MTPEGNSAPTSGAKEVALGTPQDYCEAVTGHAWEWLIATVKELTGDDTLDQLTDKKMEADNAREQAKAVDPKGGRPSETSAIGRGLQRQGSNNKQRLLRRLARDAPEILDRYEKGEFKSARATAKAADIIKEPTPFELLLKLLQKLAPSLTTSERRRLKEMLG